MTRWIATTSCTTHPLRPSVIVELDPAVTYDADTRMLTAVFEVKAATLRQAIAVSLRQARTFLGCKPTEITVLPVERHRALIEHPAPMDLLSVGDVAEVLGVSATRVTQLLDKSVDFPEPLGQPRSGPVWTRESIDAFRTRREKYPLAAGRPRKHA